VIQPYRIPDELFADMTLGPSSAATIGLLRSSQLTKHKLLTTHIQGYAAGRPDALESFAVLAAAEQRVPGAVGELLGSPFVGTWAAWCVRVIRGTARSVSGVGFEIASVAGLAAVAAAVADLPAELDVPVRDGRVVLPTLGAWTDAGHVSAVRVRIADGVIDGPDGPVATGPGWLGIRRLGGTSVIIDDVDPFRDCYRKPVADRLDPAEAARWDRRYQEAIELLATYAPGRLDELDRGLRSLVPLSTAHAEPGLSATSRAAFGALGLTLPPRPEHLAATLVHEFQHSKLSALIDLVPLYDPDATDLYFAPWRPDPRPVGGLLQGAYAFIAVCDLWHRLMPADRTGAARRQFAELRLQVARTVDTLESTPHLTAEGQRIVAGIRQQLDSILSVDLPADVDASARRALAATMDGWLVRNT
jgi:HEXXH motif-containing protein